MIEINLLPAQYRVRSEPSVWRFAAYALVPLTAAAILIPEVITATRVGDLTRQIDALNGEITALGPAEREFRALMAEKNQLEQVTGVAEQLRATKTYWTNDLAAFTARLPNDSSVAVQTMSIHNINADNLGTLQQGGIYVGKNVTREVELTGSARNQQAVVNLLRTFETDPNFGVNFRSLQNDKDKGLYTFSATVGIVGAAAQDAAAPTDPAAAPAAAPAAPAATQGAGRAN
ncbi:fimbrial assembly protein [Deinococcus aerophilus]|uniref:PilN biogenesis protein dimerization domain-containing protein n=1 Tax=Deinococcus aerophilus TaxID=522488 RepID=A0ABQ2GS65_9DEIO|nr:fimbrial assembly protein [Deinococcus aerophilus]GGM10725.1 hypothetical protein GCM10010841_18940 [Deinococcus aerophilus]